ncbi:hypothetical protein FisN_12Hh297 [Fistulifera solaris]|uniref:Uncharacterized protein n=1 Tax=Fistulifera solaris TaxID=1519565 RepID=A0A1Z5KBP8_FISSO|nr:hypothetical protein FisN_12Hh297 [Fistulifera solaris]|eukprot:GAX23720.1 hypothetical protein FisN_12Hh297 [Fistulifera solaris]
MSFSSAEGGLWERQRLPEVSKTLCTGTESETDGCEKQKPDRYYLEGTFLFARSSCSACVVSFLLTILFVLFSLSQWAGKTIALGTFPAAEADEKCARAKALTRAWRSSMRPKPTRDWVMNELERLGVRVVSGRLGRKAGEDGDEESESGDKKVNLTAPASVIAPVERRNSLAWGGDAELSALISKRNSLGLSGIMNDRRGSLGSLGPVLGMDGVDLGHRPIGSGGSVTGFDSSFHQEQQRRSSSLGLGSLNGGNLGNMGMSMLKLHHMNLLNEIQETTLMMNLYQQQQLQQQQQHLQSQVGSDISGNDAQMALLLQQQQNNQNSMDSMFGTGAAQRLNGGLGGSHAQMQMQLLQHQMQSNALPASNDNTTGKKRKGGGGKKGASGPKATKQAKQEADKGQS